MEVKKLGKAVNNNKGSGFPLAVAIALCLIMIFTGISEYFRLIIIAQGVRDALQSAVISTVNDNYDEVYHGVREGYSGGYQPFESEFEETLDYGDIYDRLVHILGLTENEEKYIKITSEGKTECILSDLDVEIQNLPLGGGNTGGQKFRIDSLIILEVPVSFGGYDLPSMKMKIKTSAGYIPKF